MDDHANSRDFGESPTNNSEPQDGSPAVDPAGVALMQDPSLSPATNVPTGFAAMLDDPFEDLEFFTRKEMMKMAFDSGVRFYQQLVIKDQRLADVTKNMGEMTRCFDHMAANLALYLNDTQMSLAFARSVGHLKLHEDPWVLAIIRERARNAAMQAAMGG